MIVNVAVPDPDSENRHDPKASIRDPWCCERRHIPWREWPRSFLPGRMGGGLVLGLAIYVCQFMSDLFVSGCVLLEQRSGKFQDDVPPWCIPLEINKAFPFQKKMLWAELEHYQSYGPVTPTVLFGKIVFQSASNFEFEYRHIRDHTVCHMLLCNHYYYEIAEVYYCEGHTCLAIGPIINLCMLLTFSVLYWKGIRKFTYAWDNATIVLIFPVSYWKLSSVGPRALLYAILLLLIGGSF